MNITTVLKQGKEQLEKDGIEQFRLEAELLLGYVLSLDREKVLAHPEYDVSEVQRSQYDQLLSKRREGTPLAYLLGYKEFYNSSFWVNEHVLVPRPETELLVEEVLKYYKSNTQAENPLMIDVGTGTGCIPISVLKELSEQKIRSFAIESQSEALKVAYRNALKHGVEDRIKFLYGSLLFPLFQEIKEIKGYSRLVITANLPYVSDSLYNKSPSIWKEPKKALLGGSDGLDLYRDLLHQANLLKQRTDIECTVFCEIDPSQISLLQEFISNNFTFYNLTFKKDLQGDYRLSILKI